MKSEHNEKCEICGKNEAVIHVQQIMGSETIELKMCERCAQEKGIAGGDKTLELSITELLTGLLNITSEVKSEQKNQICTNCGLTYNDFQKEARLGCSECAQVFRKEIHALLENLTGTHQHRGKYPKKLREFKKLLIDKAEIKQKLQEAIQREDYEGAAVLRDKIHDLERVTENGDES